MYNFKKDVSGVVFSRALPLTVSTPPLSASLSLAIAAIPALIAAISIF